MAKNDNTRVGRRAFLKMTSAGAASAAAVSGLVVGEALAAENWHDFADVVVLGYGGAGACAAIAAHDAGANVVLLEKQAEATLVNNTRMAGGIWHCPNGNRTAIKEYAKAMMSGENMPWKLEGEEPDVSDELADVWATDSPGTVDFLKSLDPDFNAIRTGGPAFPTFPGAREAGYRVFSATYTDKADNTVPTRNLPKNQKMNGEAFFTALMTGVANRKITVRYETPAQELIRDASGQLLGVLATRDGKPFRVKASRGVVISTGGFEYSVPMRRAFLDGPGVKGWAFWGTPHNTGDGIRMAMSLGARLDKVSKSAAGLIFAAPSSFSGLMMGVGRAVIGQPHSMVVDNYGNRYDDETLQSKDPSRYFFYKEATQLDIRTLDYPRIPSWQIFDETYRPANALATQGMGPASQGLVKWAADNSDAIEKGWILKADTIDALAAMIQAHPDNRKLMTTGALIKSLNRFNELSAKGKDEDFNRPANTLGAIEKRPFYAAPMYAGGPNTKGGIAANAKREVLDWDGNPIGRLYTAGEVSSAFKFVYQGGGNLAECIVFGRIAGRNAAANTPWG